MKYHASARVHELFNSSRERRIKILREIAHPAGLKRSARTSIVARVRAARIIQESAAPTERVKRPDRVAARGSNRNFSGRNLSGGRERDVRRFLFLPPLLFTHEKSHVGSAFVVLLNARYCTNV